jgi:hypothetical protein
MSPGWWRRPNQVLRPETHATAVIVRGDTEVATWPVVGPGRPDLATVEAVARLHLHARRLGCAVRLRDLCPELAALLELVGLGEVVGQPEDGEEPGVEEVVVGDDPIA